MLSRLVLPWQDLLLARSFIDFTEQRYPVSIKLILDVQRALNVLNVGQLGDG